MTELQQIFPKWSLEDLNVILRLSNGDCDLAIQRALEHERTGLPVEVLIRSLVMESRSCHQYGEQGLRRHESGGKQAASAQLGHDHAAVARDSPAYAAAPTSSSARSHDYLGGRNDELNHRNRRRGGNHRGVHPSPSSNSHVGSSEYAYEYGSSVPTMVHVNSGGERRKDPPFTTSASQALSEPRLSPSLSAYTSPEAILQRLSPQEKDQLLRQYLSFPVPYPGRQVRGNKVASIPSGKSVLSPQEIELLNIQSGIHKSYKEFKTDDDLNNGALELGINASIQDFRDHCHKRELEMKMEKVVLKQAVEESLNSPDYIADRVDIMVIEEVKRSSLSSSISEEQQIEEAKQNSVAYTRPLSQEERLIDEVKRDSLANLDIFMECEAITSASYATAQGPGATIQPLHASSQKRSYSQTSAAQASSAMDDGSSIGYVEGTTIPCMPLRERETSQSSTVSDCKPPALVNNESISGTMLNGEFPSMLNFGTYDVGFVLPGSYRNDEEDSSTSKK